MHNLKTVVSFEFFRTIKKPTFWISALSVPFFTAVIGGLVYFANTNADRALEENTQEKFSMVVADDSGLITPAVVQQFGGRIIDSHSKGIEAVKDGKVDAFLYYPKDPAKNGVEIHGKDIGLTKNYRYDAVADMLLTSSIASTTGDAKAALLQQEPEFKTTTYKNGDVTPGFERMIAPGVFIVLFLVVTLSLIGQMLTSTTEEKENRVTEIILTTIKARTLIVGKIIGIVATGVLQFVVIALPILVGYLLFRDELNLGTIDLSSIPLDPVAITIGALLFISSFFLYTGLFVATGAAVPTAKEANSFLSIFYVMMFAPGWIGITIFSDPDSLIVKLFSYFPFTAPTTLMVRNTFGNLPLHEAIIGISIITVVAILAIAIAVRIFRYGIIEYTRQLSLKEIFGRNKA